LLSLTQISSGADFALQGRDESRLDLEGSRISWDTGAFGSDSNTETEEMGSTGMYPLVPAIFREDIIINPHSQIGVEPVRGLCKVYW